MKNLKQQIVKITHLVSLVVLGSKEKENLVFEKKKKNK